MSNQENKNSTININISTGSVLRVMLILVGIWFVYLIRDILVLVVISVFLAMVFEPYVNYFNRKRIPRALSVAIIYAIIFFALSIALLLLIPPLIEQISHLAANFPVYWDKIISSIEYIKEYSEDKGLLEDINQGIQSLRTSFVNSSLNMFSLISSIFGNIISFILVFVLTFYLLLHEGAIKKTFGAFTPKKYQPYFFDLISRIQARLSQWFKGELTLGLIVGLMSLVGLWVLGIRYFLVLAIVAGMFELVPYIGPVLGAIPAVFLAFTQSPIKGLAVLILCWIIQQIENHLIVPKVMQKAIGINPIIIIIVILIGARLAGFIGVVLALPTTVTLSVIIKDFFDNSDLRKASEETKN